LRFRKLHRLVLTGVSKLFFKLCLPGASLPFLKHATVVTGRTLPRGIALLVGCYSIELVLRLLVAVLFIEVAVVLKTFIVAGNLFINVLETGIASQCRFFRNELLRSQGFADAAVFASVNRFRSTDSGVRLSGNGATSRGAIACRCGHSLGA